MEISPALDLIRMCEGCRLAAYPDATGIPTIGWGHTGPDVQLGQTITREDADDLLVEDVSRCAERVADLVAMSVNNNQFCAFVSFAYNVGVSAFGESTMLRDFNAGVPNVTVAAQFLLWTHAGGVQLEGLIRRRQLERALFLAAVTQG